MDAHRRLPKVKLPNKGNFIIKFPEARFEVSRVPRKLQPGLFEAGVSHSRAC